MSVWKESKYSRKELKKAQDSVIKHNAEVIYSKAVKPSVHAPEDEDFEKIYKEALERLVSKEKRGLR